MMAREQYGAQMVVLAGGVSANTKLKNKIQKLARDSQIPFVAPTRILYSMDNAAMVGIRAYYEYQKTKEKH
jgi:N6-L-threonylcarbamoyladenine synthase